MYEQESGENSREAWKEKRLGLDIKLLVNTFLFLLCSFILSLSVTYSFSLLSLNVNYFFSHLSLYNSLLSFNSFSLPCFPFYMSLVRQLLVVINHKFDPRVRSK